jgi:hypothetical protein
LNDHREQSLGRDDDLRVRVHELLKEAEERVRGLQKVELRVARFTLRQARQEGATCVVMWCDTVTPLSNAFTAIMLCCVMLLLPL